ncbi:MAG: type III-A CRISPR-associated RAMP protein Csm5 [Cyanobacteria bacterium J06555_13]
MPKPDVCETQQIRLSSRLLHIGAAVSELSPFEYVNAGRFVYLPRADALARALKARGALNDYIWHVEHREPIGGLLKNALGDEWWQATDAGGRDLFPTHLRSLNWVKDITKLRPMIRNGFGHHYIPGSSIKGAMRTAIAYHLLKHGSQYNLPKAQRVSQIEERLQKSMGTLRRKSRFADDPLFMDALFSEYDLYYQNRKIKSRQGPNTDIMRAVQVSDSEPLIEQRIQPENRRPYFRNLSIVSEVVVSSRFADYRAKHRSAIYAEMELDVDTQFTLSIDHDMLSWFRHKQGMKIPFNSVEKLLKICQEFAQDQWDFEHDYWAEIKNNSQERRRALDFDYIRDFYEPERCPYGLRMGWASGFMGTTINMLMPDQTAAQIRDTCGIKAPGFEAPKSRRTVLDGRGDIRFAPGWVKFKQV